MILTALRFSRISVPVLLPLLLATGAVAQARPVPASASAPSWWSGVCDVGNHPGSHPLGASYDGVQACGPGPAQGGDDQLVRFYPGAWGEFEWECVELAMRYMYLVYGIVPYNANGNTVVADYQGTVLAKVANDGTSLPAPGDIVSEAGTSENPNGHTGVVTAVNVAGGTGTVTIMEQNASPAGATTIPVAGGALGSGVTGWLHHGSSSGGGGGGGSGPPPPTPQVPWRFRDFGGTAGTGGAAGHGVRPAAVTYRGALHVFYYDARHGYLRHAWHDAGGWHFEVLDGAGGAQGRVTGNAGVSPAAVVKGRTLHVFYHDATTGSVRHAWLNAAGWHFATLDAAGTGSAATTAVVYRRHLQVFYPDSDTGDLRHAWRTVTGWHFQNLDGDPGSVAGRQGNASPAVGGSVASTGYGRSLQVFYYSASAHTLRHAWKVSHRWHFENLDGGNTATLSGDTDSIGRNPSVAVDGGVLHVFAYDATTGDLRHDWYDSTGWHFENLDGPTSAIGPDRFHVGLYSAALADGATMAVFYYDSTWGELRHAWYSPGSGWRFENLDGLGGLPASREGPGVRVGLYPEAVMDARVPQVFYYDASHGVLRHAWPR